MSCKKEGVICKDLKVEQEDKAEHAYTDDELEGAHRKRRDLENQLVSCMEEREALHQQLMEQEEDHLVD
jgi:hypothetical protein